MPEAPIRHRHYDDSILRAIKDWQGVPHEDATYRDAQTLLRGEPTAAWTAARFRRTATTIDQLFRAFDAGHLTRDVTLFRGVRDLEASFGGPLPAIDRPQAERMRRLSGFVATTRDVRVVEEFIPRRGTLLAMRVAAGTPAIDVGHWGHAERSHQHEILLPSDLDVEITEFGRGRDICTSQLLANRLVVYLNVA